MGILLAALIQPRFLAICLLVYPCGHAVSWQTKIWVSAGKIFGSWGH